MKLIEQQKVKAVWLMPIVATLTIIFLFSISPSVFAEEVSWTGCGITKKAFMTEIAKAYKKKTGIKITLSGGGATKGIRTASAGTSDLGGACRHRLYDASGTVHPEEKNADLTLVALDAIVVITHPDNPVKNISMTELRKIYDGEITNWKDLGGPDKRIVLVTRTGKSSGVGHMFRRIVFNAPEYTFKARSIKVKSSGPLEKKVEKTVTALGVTGISSAKKRNVKSLSLDGMKPTKENIASGKYPLWRPLYLTANKNSSEKVRSVIGFVLSDEGQAIVSSQGTVNLAEGKALAGLWKDKKGSMGIN
jgi:phosphate transport system substrate-binding protein